MQIKVIFEVASVVRTSDGGVQTFPNTGEPAPLGVGIETTGRYVVKAKKHVSGDFIYNRINAYQDNQGHLHGIGHLVMNLCHQGNDIAITSTYTNRTLNPENAFSVDKLIAPITSATVNNLLAQGQMVFKSVDGGRCYKVCITLEPVHRCPPPPCPPGPIPPCPIPPCPIPCPPAPVPSPYPHCPPPRPSCSCGHGKSHSPH